MADEQTPGGILERLRNSPRTVSTIIVILIIAGAIFAFSDRGKQPAPSPAGEQPAGGESETTPVTEASPEGTPGASPAVEGAGGEPQPATPEPSPLPEPSETADAYTEVAERGEGVTHLARKATTRYVAANMPDFEVTNEHRVFIEDYLKDQTGRAPLNLGETRAFSKDLIREAVEASKGLTDAQLTNLQKYSQRVQWE